MSAVAQPLLVKCPTCNQSVPWTAEQKFRPFCSERCKLIDLGEWVMEEKRIAGDSVLIEEDNSSENLWQ
jgi:endogenous inhibitor of DNA gyrase (YacG/DUF329 family)